MNSLVNILRACKHIQIQILERFCDVKAQNCLTSIAAIRAEKNILHLFNASPLVCSTYQFYGFNFLKQFLITYFSNICYYFGLDTLATLQ